MSTLAFKAQRLWVMTLLVFGRTQPAIAQLRDMQRQWPHDWYVLSSLGHLYLQTEQRPQARELLQRATEAHPDNAHGWFNWGFVLEEDGEIERARDCFLRATELSPLLDRAWYGLGLTYIRLNQLDLAVQALKRNTQLQPMSPYGWYQLARVHLDRQEPQEVQNIIRHLKGFEPKVAAQLERETGFKVPAAL